ncbi:MAG TPA: helix-turn-helix transcriptional regulator [Streptosporangiaceae bacterium]|nr:helix-turn-helix transcriptional regulator [Streptosporangiaceae bacterium]
MVARRLHLAGRRKAMGFSQESLAARLGADRSTIARWERGESQPQPFIRPRLSRLLGLTPSELENLLNPRDPGRSEQARAVPDAGRPEGGQVFPGSAADDDELNRRELLRLLSVTGALVAMPEFTGAGDGDNAGRAADIEQHQVMNKYLWRVFSLSAAKPAVYPLVRQQLAVLAENLNRPHVRSNHALLCALAADLLQLGGEISFDSGQYTDAANCYTLAASACAEARAFDLWACALTRHAFVALYERRYSQASSMLDVAARVARQGDSQLATRYWTQAVQAQARASLRDADGCDRALDAAEQVRTLGELSANGGWDNTLLGAVGLSLNPPRKFG